MSTAAFNHPHPYPARGPRGRSPIAFRFLLRPLTLTLLCTACCLAPPSPATGVAFCCHPSRWKAPPHCPLRFPLPSSSSRRPSCRREYFSPPLPSAKGAHHRPSSSDLLQPRNDCDKDRKSTPFLSDHQADAGDPLSASPLMSSVSLSSPLLPITIGEPTSIQSAPINCSCHGLAPWLLPHRQSTVGRPDFSSEPPAEKGEFSPSFLAIGP
jgi:hypothetical protein